MLLVLKAAESVLDWSPLSKLYLAISRACYPEAEVRFPRTRGYGILLSKRMLGASVLISTKNFGKEKSGKVNWKTWCHPTILSSVIPFSCPQSFPESGSFPVSQLASGSSLHQVAKVLELQLQHQSFQQILELSGRLYFWRWLCQYIPAHILFFFKKFNFLFYVKNPCQQWKQTKSI